MGKEEEGKEGGKRERKGKSCNAMLANREELRIVIYHISSLIFIPGSSIVLIMKAPPGMMKEGERRPYERFRSCVTLTRLTTNINVSVYEHTTHKQKWSCDYTRPQLLNCQTQSHFSRLVQEGISTFSGHLYTVITILQLYKRQ